MFEVCMEALKLKTDYNNTIMKYINKGLMGFDIFEIFYKMSLYIQFSKNYNIGCFYIENNNEDNIMEKGFMFRTDNPDIPNG